MGNQAHPGECKPREVCGLQRAKCVTSPGISSKLFQYCHEMIPDRQEQLGIRRAETRLNTVQIAD